MHQVYVCSKNRSDNAYVSVQGKFKTRFRDIYDTNIWTWNSMIGNKTDPLFAKDHF